MSISRSHPDRRRSGPMRGTDMRSVPMSRYSKGMEKKPRETALLRTELGDVLRDIRQRQGRTLREVSSEAQVSLGYLSEVERGQSCSTPFPTPWGCPCGSCCTRSPTGWRSSMAQSCPMRFPTTSCQSR